MFTFNGFLAKLKTKFSTNKTPTNNHRFPLVLSDGSPDGNATPADVMQLLGVSWITIFKSGALSECYRNGLYAIQYNNVADITDIPCNGHGYMINLSATNTSSTTFAQLYVSIVGRAFFRVRNGAGVLSNWKELAATEIS